MDIVSNVYSFVAFPPKELSRSANCFLTEVRHGEMAKQTEEFGPFKPFSHYIRKNKASEKQNIHCYKNLGNFDEKKQTDVFDKL